MLTDGAPGRATLVLVGLAVIALLLGSPARATTETSSLNIAGTYAGSGSEKESEESEPTETEDFDITLTVEETSSFTGSGRQIFADGFADFTFEGELFSDGSISGTWESVDEDGEKLSGSFSGTFDGQTIKASYSGGGIVDCCSVFVEGEFTATKDAVGATASSDTGSTVDNQRTSVTGTANLVTQRVTRVMSGLRGEREASTGVTPVAGGFMLEAGPGRSGAGRSGAGRSGGGQSAGGAMASPWGLWASYQRSDFEDDFAATAFDADRDAVFVGADVSPWDHFVIGVAIGYASSDIDTAFNAGNQDIDEFTVVPYLGALVSDKLGVPFDLGVDFSIGYSTIDIEQFRTAAGTRVTSELDADRWFVSGNVNASKAYGPWYLTGRGGLLWARDDNDGFTESDGTVVGDRKFTLGQARIGAEVAYTWNAMWGSLEPFLNATYQHDFQREDLVVATGRQPANDNDDVDLGAGLRVFGRERLSGTFEYHTVLGREDFDSDSFSLLLRAQF